MLEGDQYWAHSKSEPIWLLLVQLRSPLIALIVTYSISILGLVLIPGETDLGSPYYLSFLDAFYAVSYTAMTVGFGEIPYPFNQSQRLWMLLVMYSTVIAWLYAIGSILSVFSDPAFHRIRSQNRSISQVRSHNEPFWILCGFDDTGFQLIQFLDQAKIRCVVVDEDPERIDCARLINLSYEPAVFLSDPSEPQILVDSGVSRPHCCGVLALTGRDQINLMIATNARVLSPRLSVYSRSNTDFSTRNLRSFGTEVVIDPNRAIVHRLVQMIRRPNTYALHNELIDPDFNQLSVHQLSDLGHWIICASGRFSELVVEAFVREGIPLCLVSREPPEDPSVCDWVEGVGTEAITLREAGILNATGVIAGTTDDGDNLSILLTALEEKPALFSVARRNRSSSELVFRHGQFNEILREDRVIAQEMFARIQTPLLNQFLGHLEAMPDSLVFDIIGKMSHRRSVEQSELDHFALVLTAAQAPGVVELLQKEATIKLGDLLIDPLREQPLLPAICLLIARLNADVIPIPGDELDLVLGDQLLLWGEAEALNRIKFFIGRPDLFEANIKESDPLL
ncbi:NAD-binding protein [Litorivicinus sp.]|nr:NAD-binding protein [Litorivicinus sp.]